MADPIITNITPDYLELNDVVKKAVTLTVGGAVEYPKGMLLARDSSTGNAVPYVSGGSTNDNGTPRMVLAEAVSASGAGDVATSAIIGGELYYRGLSTAADGTITELELGSLQDNNIAVRRADDQTVYDNQ